MHEGKLDFDIVEIDFKVDDRLRHARLIVGFYQHSGRVAQDQTVVDVYDDQMEWLERFDESTNLSMPSLRANRYDKSALASIMSAHYHKWYRANIEVESDDGRNAGYIDKIVYAVFPETALEMAIRMVKEDDPEIVVFAKASDVEEITFVEAMQVIAHRNALKAAERYREQQAVEATYEYSPFNPDGSRKE